MTEPPRRPFAVQPLLNWQTSSYTTVPSSLGRVCVTSGPLHMPLLLPGILLPLFIYETLLSSSYSSLLLS